MYVTRLVARNFRSYRRLDLSPAPGLNVFVGENAVGKTNLLEAIYFACTARSCLASNDRHVVAFDEQVTRLELHTESASAQHVITVGFAVGQPKKCEIDKAPVDHLTQASARPLVSVFFPHRLELVTGGPSLRRAHIDQVLAALWPVRDSVRRSYSAALTQRNALLLRIRAGAASQSSLRAWNQELARHGLALMQQRADLISRLAPRFEVIAQALGLEGEVSLKYRPRSQAKSTEELTEELEARTASDIERGFSGHGPHRDEIALHHGGRELRTFGSRGQQRLGLLALLLSEREELASERAALPLLLLDDAMSELDQRARNHLATSVHGRGQVFMTATDRDHVPLYHDDIAVFGVTPGSVSQASSKGALAA